MSDAGAEDDAFMTRAGTAHNTARSALGGVAAR